MSQIWSHKSQAWDGSQRVFHPASVQSQHVLQALTECTENWPHFLPWARFLWGASTLKLLSPISLQLEWLFQGLCQTESVLLGNRQIRLSILLLFVRYCTSTEVMGTFTVSCCYVWISLPYSFRKSSTRRNRFVEDAHWKTTAHHLVSGPLWTERWSKSKQM